MPILALAELLFQAFCIRHAMMSGKQEWIYILLIPGVGPVAYTIMELIPSFANTRRGQRVVVDVKTILDPDAEYRKRKQDVELSGTPAAKAALAEECARKGMFDDAAELYRSALTGMYADDPNLLLAYAKILIDKGDFAEAQAALDHLRAKNPNFQSSDGHLLYARTLEGQGKNDEATAEYEAVSAYFPGFEAKVRYALFVQKLGQAVRAREMMEAVVKAYKQLPRHAQDLNRDWYNVARRNLEA